MQAKLFMLDDHQAMLEGYKAILSMNQNLAFETTDANSCEQAYTIITQPEKFGTFDFAFLDYSVPAFEAQQLYSGEDVALLVRKHHPSTKIMVLTSHYDGIRLFELIKKVQPEGLLVKSDFKPQDLNKAIEVIQKGENYYSETVVNNLKEKLLSHGLLDSIDRKIIQLIAEGFQIKTIAEKLNLSHDTIKKRKSKIKYLLGIEKGNDEDLLMECRRLNLI
jgi:DNA-binding NarL/FixJ family response regulator